MTEAQRKQLGDLIMVCIGGDFRSSDAKVALVNLLDENRRLSAEVERLHSNPDEGYRLTSKDLKRIINDSLASTDLQWAVKDLLLAHYELGAAREQKAELTREKERADAHFISCERMLFEEKNKNKQEREILSKASKSIDAAITSVFGWPWPILGQQAFAECVKAAQNMMKAQWDTIDGLEAQLKLNKRDAVNDNDVPISEYSIKINQLAAANSLLTEAIEQRDRSLAKEIQDDIKRDTIALFRSTISEIMKLRKAGIDKLTIEHIKLETKAGELELKLKLTTKVMRSAINELMQLRDLLTNVNKEAKTYVGEANNHIRHCSFITPQNIASREKLMRCVERASVFLAGITTIEQYLKYNEEI